MSNHPNPSTQQFSQTNTQINTQINTQTNTLTDAWNLLADHYFHKTPRSATEINTAWGIIYNFLRQSCHYDDDRAQILIKNRYHSFSIRNYCNYSTSRVEGTLRSAIKHRHYDDLRRNNTRHEKMEYYAAEQQQDLQLDEEDIEDLIIDRADHEKLQSLLPQQKAMIRNIILPGYPQKNIKTFDRDWGILLKRFLLRKQGSMAEILTTQNNYTEQQLQSFYKAIERAEKRFEGALLHVQGLHGTNLEHVKICKRILEALLDEPTRRNP